MSLIFGLIAICLLIACHWASQFVLGAMGALTRVLVLFILGTGIFAVLYGLFDTPLEETFAAYVWFAFFCELYVFLFTLSLSSISIKLIQMLYKKPMTSQEVQTLYQPNAMVDKRFERLIIAGLIYREGADLD